MIDCAASEQKNIPDKKTQPPRWPMLLLKS
jgi:hypothetical protein